MSSESVARRGFLAWATGGIAALIGVILAIPLVGYILSPAFKRRESPWVQVGNVDELRPGEPEELEYVSTIEDGWRKSTAKRIVWGVKEPQGSVVVFSPICPHLGCGFRWDSGERKFKCPCHGSMFDVTGKVVGGPAPRPLDKLPSKTENGKILTIYKQFKSGVDHQVEL